MVTSTTPEQSEAITDGLYKEQYAQGQIIAYRITEVSPDILQSWADLVVETLQNRDTTRPYIALHDFSTRGVIMKFTMLQKNLLNLAITDDGMQRVAPLIDQGTGFKGRVALLVSIQFSGYMASTLAALEAHQQRNTHIDYQVFTERESALRWLLA